MFLNNEIMSIVAIEKVKGDVFYFILYLSRQKLSNNSKDLQSILLIYYF